MEVGKKRSLEREKEGHNVVGYIRERGKWINEQLDYGLYIHS